MRNAETSIPLAGAKPVAIQEFVALAKPVDLADWLAGLKQAEIIQHVTAMALPRRTETFSHLPLNCAVSTNRTDWVESVRVVFGTS